MPMDIRQRLEEAGLDPDSPLLEHPTLAEALASLMETMESYCPSVDASELSAEDWLALLAAYREAVLAHPSASEQQERSALMEAWEVLQRRGASDDEYQDLDFGGRGDWGLE